MPVRLNLKLFCLPGFISGNFMGVDVTFVYVDPLLDSTKIPSRGDEI